MLLWHTQVEKIEFKYKRENQKGQKHISPLLATEFLVAQWLEHATRSWRAVGSNPIWNSDFSEFSVGSISNFI